MIEVRELTKSFGGTSVLRGIDLTLEQGQVLVVIGPSGSGKSTLLRCLNALEVPTSGTVTIGRARVEFRPNEKPRKKDVLALRRQSGMVFQAYHLFPHFTALQNVMEGQVTVRRRPKNEARAKALQLLAKVGLEDRADAYPHQLSGGQQQRVGIARAMSIDPELLLFDEPTSALDPELVREVLKVIRELAEEGRTMMIVTHEMKFAREVADRIVLLDGGVIVEEGPPDQLFGQPREARTRQFLSLLMERSLV
ncbi:amino acid ABC transporter ATP-binding protein [Paenibacillus sacheonensis]|uniref:ATP-binding cassette domain-containing protein n=1 Tax=Paenibacillus sacheonensis TaxID=742054 RepID=A0A7X4YQ90_9BACL|nr:amino acid ABC transporter ATP-binding protein [Paenibacillus sacheonensis]MBM7566333.1 cystine transport system ATP-binding protein [Paenibacillus sacheonensis]NBC70537.1 ATP-binding cassette domain-containing protein [Paenibacillus sacheonensis]